MKITQLFKKIYTFFDKKIVLPITRLVFKVSEKSTKSSKKLENILSKQSTLLFVSLFLAIFIFVIVDQKIIRFNTSSAEVFKNVPVKVSYAEERFVIEGIPETVDITLIGSKADLYIAKQSSSQNVNLDLNYITKPGTYSVPVEYNHGLSSIEYSVNPSEVTVVVYLKESQNRGLSYNVVNTNLLDSALDISDVSLNVDNVTISGAAYKLDKVANVEALIDVNKIPNLVEGTQNLDDITLRAYDADGNPLDVEISTTSKVQAKVTISSSSRKVNLNFVPVGNIPFGKAISAYTFSQNYVTVYGSNEVLDELAKTGIDIKVDATKLTQDYHDTIEIPKLTGVKKLEFNKVDVDVSVTDVADPVTLTVKIDALNVPEGFTASAASVDDSQVLVELKGAENIVSVLTNADIQAYVDLGKCNLEEPVCTPEVKVKANTANARLVNLTSKKSTVNINLIRNS